MVLQGEERPSQQQLPVQNDSCVEEGPNVLHKLHMREMTGIENYSTLDSALLERSISIKQEKTLCKSDVEGNFTEELFQVEQSESTPPDYDSSVNTAECSLSSACISSHCEGLSASCEGNHCSHTDSSADLNRLNAIARDKEGSFKCNRCNYTATLLSTLKNHVRCLHTNQTLFKCDQCSYAASKVGSLKRHIVIVHNKERPFKCNECTYAASTSQHLKTHVVRVHNKERQFKCEQCNFTASCSGNLKQHVVRIHNKERP